MTLNTEPGPDITSKDGRETREERGPQITITANKISPDQNVGLQFKDIDGKVVVAAISGDSIFQNTGLEIGDQIIGVMGVDCKSNGDSQQAIELITKSQREVTLVIEKTQTSSDTTNGGERIQDKGVLGISQHSERQHGSPLRKITSENSSSEEENPSKEKGRTDEIQVTVSEAIKKKKVNPGNRKIRKIKAGGTPKTTTTKSIQKQPKEPKGSESNHSNSSRIRRLITPQDDDNSDESSLGETATEEKKAQTQEGTLSVANSPLTRKQNPTTNPSKSLTFDYQNFSGDYVKATVRKESETRSGFLFEKFDGKIILAAVPQHEKRIFPGMQVLGTLPCRGYVV